MIKSNGLERRATTDANGDYCFEVKPDSYEIVPTISDKERKEGLRLTPKTKTIQVNDKPVFKADFKQLELKVQG